jgi:hypothetical protein
VWVQNLPTVEEWAEFDGDYADLIEQVRRERYCETYEAVAGRSADGLKEFARRNKLAFWSYERLEPRAGADARHGYDGQPQSSISSRIGSPNIGKEKSVARPSGRVTAVTTHFKEYTVADVARFPGVDRIPEPPTDRELDLGEVVDALEVLLARWLELGEELRRRSYDIPSDLKFELAELIREARSL